MRSGRMKSSGEAGAHGRRGGLWVSLLLATACLTGPTAASAAETTVFVTLDHADILPYPAGTETIVVGNPIIADVTMLKNTGKVVLTGRGYGETNLVFLDGTGQILSEARLKVRMASTSLVVQRGLDRETYSCQTRCEPVVSLGDNHDFLRDAIKDIQVRNGLASGAAAAAAIPQR